jgi:hypothetical protein
MSNENENEKINENENNYNFKIFYTISLVFLIFIALYFTFPTISNATYYISGQFLATLYLIINSTYINLFNLIKGIYVSLLWSSIPSAIYAYGLEPLISSVSYFLDILRYSMSTLIVFLIGFMTLSINNFNLIT